MRREKNFSMMGIERERRRKGDQYGEETVETAKGKGPEKKDKKESVGRYLVLFPSPSHHLCIISLNGETERLWV